MNKYVEEKVRVKGDVENLDLRVGDYKALVKLVYQILSEADNLPEPQISPEHKQEGLKSSLQGSDQVLNVPMTPIMEKMLEEDGHDDYIKYDAPLTKTELKINAIVMDKLRSQGKITTEYPETDELLSRELYHIDCCRNRKDNMRDIGPGQAVQRAKTFVLYTKKPDYSSILNLLNDGLFQKVVEEIWPFMPTVTADTDFKETSLPFDKKHSNVGYPFFHRDKAVDEETKKTYGQLSRELAETATFQTLPNYNVAMVFGRNQRLKGRLIIAMSRVMNLFLNRLEAREIEKLKTDCPFFAGYRSAPELKKVISQMVNDALSKGYRMSNWDQSGFDVHINPVWIALVGAMRVASTKGALGKKIAYWRAVYNIRQWVLDGLSGRFVGIWGRMPSGFIDTNQLDSWVEILATTYCLAKQDPSYFNEVLHKFKYVMLAMGDDCLMMYRPEHFSQSEFVADMSKLGFEVNMEKYDYGPFFLQNRVFKEGNIRMAYPWTRVLKSMLFKENPRQLGTGGWLVAFLQQLSKLFEDAQALDSVVSIVAPYDKLCLGYSLSADDVVNMVKEEDKKAQEEQKPKDYRPTAEKLYDGDPQKMEQFEGEGLDKGWIANALAIVRKSLDRLHIRP